MSEPERSRELDVLSGPQAGFLSLVRIIAVLIARTGETTIEIGAAELDALPDVPALSTWRNPTSLTDFVHVELSPRVVARIRDFGHGLADERAGIVDAEVVDDEPVATPMQLAAAESHTRAEVAATFGLDEDNG